MINIILTNKQQNQMKLPTRLDVFRELNKRGGLNKDNLDEFNRLNAGHAGESAVLQFIEDFGQNHWVVMKNIWIDYYGEFESDLVLITRHGVFTFEIKNFSGHYEFLNSQCLRNGEKYGRNPITQAQRVYIQLQSIFQKHSISSPIAGHIVFIGPHCSVNVIDKVADLEVILANQLRDYLWKIANDERKSIAHKINVQQIVQTFENYEIVNPFPPITIDDETNQKMRKGILCCQCGSFNISKKTSYMSCDCGMHEPREMAIVRTICEYGVIHFDKQLLTTELVHFFGGDLERRTVIKYLKQYFNQVGIGRATKFINPRRNFEEIKMDFSFTRFRYLAC